MASDKKMDFKVVFIGGFGRSGSTLIDIFLGNHHDFFSMGEIMQINRESLKEELCSCRNKITNCEFWSTVISEWEKRRSLTKNDFIKFDAKYRLSLRNIIFHLKARFKRVDKLDLFHSDYRLLLEIIDENCSEKFLIDSSKNPFRLLLYRRVMSKENIVSIQVFRHATRVLNSYKKPWEKNIEQGIEKDIAPRKTLKVLRKFFSHHIWTRLLSTGLKRKKLIYERLISETEYRNELLSFLLDRPEQSQVKTMTPGHLIAGNRLRLQKDIVFDTSLLKKGLKGKYVSNLDIQLSRALNAVTKLLIS